MLRDNKCRSFGGGRSMKIPPMRMPPKRMLTAALLASLLAGCTMGPKYSRPAVKTPDTFRGADAVPSPDPSSLGDLKWFEVFKDEQLQQLMRTALVQNYDLRDAVARVLEARA